MSMAAIWLHITGGRVALLLKLRAQKSSLASLLLCVSQSCGFSHSVLSQLAPPALVIPLDDDGQNKRMLS